MKIVKSYKREITNPYSAIVELESMIEETVQKISHKPSKYITISNRSGLDFIKVENVLYLSADSNYSLIHFTDGSKRMVSKSLIHFERELDSAIFLRIHSSYMVNKDKLVRLCRTSKPTLEIENGVILPISRSKKDTILEDLLK